MFAKNNAAAAAAVKANQVSQKSGTTSLSRDLQMNSLTKQNKFKQVQTRKSNEKFVEMVEDYDVDPAHYQIEKPIENFTKQQMIEKHPLQLAAEKSRHSTNVVGKLKSNQIALTNLPQGFKIQQAIELCQQSVPNLEVYGSRTVTSLNSDDRNSFIVLDLAGERQVVDLTKKMRHIWVDDRLIKLRTLKDAKREHFNQRTLIIRDIPKSYQIRDMIKLFEQHGQITSIELPTRSSTLSASAKGEFIHNKEYRIQEERQRRHAEQVIQDNLRMDEDYHGMLIDHFGEEGKNLFLAQDDRQETKSKDKYELLDVEKINSVVRQITQLQAEGTQVTNSKQLLHELRQKLQQDTSSSSSTVPSAKNIDEKALKKDKKNIQKIVKYLTLNKDNLDTTSQQALSKWAHSSSTIEEMLQTSVEEVAYAYDELIELLESRENIIQKRLIDSVRHFGTEERILVEQTNDKLQDMPKVYDFAHKYSFKVEEILSIQEQISNVQAAKTMTNEQKFYGLVNKSLNPFEKFNFTDLQLKDTQNTELDDIKIKHIDIPDPRVLPFVHRMTRQGKGFLPQFKKNIDNLVAELRGRIDLPFDELYHKERQLVNAVVEAEKAIKRKEANFRLSFEGKEYDLNATDYMGEPIVKKSPEENYELQQQRKADKLLQDKLGMKDQANSSYQYLNSLQSKYESLMEQGLMTRKEYELAKAHAKELDQDNLGYCFVTFSHADEARMMLYQNDFTFIDNNRIQVNLKQNVDHGDLDQAYTLQKLKNDATLVEEIKELRQARKDLRDFEENYDSHLPKNIKLKEFRDFARDVIENKPYRKRQAKMSRRTQQEERELDDKIRQYQKENPTVDMTPLFDTDRADDARKELHKRQYASYKAFTFLKNGIKKAEDSNKDAAYSVSQRKLEENDPYNFPALNESVNQVLSNQIDVPRVLDQGEVIDTPGRRFNYSTQEFLEAYLGKDFRRMPNLKTDESLTFEFQEDMKHKYKIEDYLMKPKIEARKQRIDDLDLNLLFSAEGIPEDPELRRLSNNLQAELDNQEDLPDMEHPEDPTRTYMGDLQKLQEEVASYESNQVNIGKTSRRLKDIREEYFGARSQDWFSRAMNTRKDPLNYDDYIEEGSEEEQEEDAAQDAKFEADYKNDSDEETEQTQEREQILDEYTDHDDEHLYSRNILTKQQQMVNNEALHKLSYAIDYNKDVTTEELDQLNQIAESNDESVQDLYFKKSQLDQIGDKERYGGVNFQNQSLGIANDYDLDEELSKMNSRQRTSPKGLRQFADEQDDDLSEREDEDVYAHYIRQMNKNKQEQFKPEDLTENYTAQEYEKLTNNMSQKVPTLGEYFQNEDRNESPFQKQADSAEAFDFNLQDEQYHEIEKDNDLYKRELYARFMGESLTTRQFELVTGVQWTGKDKTVEGSKRHQRDQFLQNRDWIRLNDERIEQHRRQQVRDGTWTEEESYAKIKQVVNKFYAKVPSSKEKQKLRNGYLEYLNKQNALDHPNRLMEREYHFDETLGQSLQAHVDELKLTFPGLKVQTRRDRDGFAVVKTISKPQYKYDLDQINNIDLSSMQKLSNECHEALFEVMYPEGFANHVKENMENPDRSNHYQQYDFDQETKESLKKLMGQRIFGEIDQQEFKENLQLWQDNASYDHNTIFSREKLAAQVENGMSDAIKELQNDRQLIEYELAAQIKARTNELKQFTKRKHEDFVKPKVSEKNLFKIQTMELDDVTNDMEANLPSEDKQQEEDFDRSAYEKLRAEIKQRRDAKESILRQGYPEFKPYMRL